MTIEPDIAVIRHLETAEQVQQRRLSRSRSASDRDALTRIRLEGDAAQDVNALSIRRNETLTQIDDLHHESRSASTGRIRDAARAGKIVASTLRTNATSAASSISLGFAIKGTLLIE